MNCIASFPHIDGLIALLILAVAVVAIIYILNRH